VCLKKVSHVYGWLIVDKSMGAGLAYRLYASFVCDVNSAAAAEVYGLWRYMSFPNYQ